MMALVRKTNLPIHIADALSILNYMPNSLLLHLAKICHIDMGDSQEEKNRDLALYKVRRPSEDIR